ncbi:unnamed protein product [Symbiodinium natans]|uniref:Uncharacterized protein n=1 Tax=Symbiodinium natans TaxID=878477 RepID=A0A812RZD1_9DINO|nr:unnamed protein product [Symbiodinium natans]
MRFFMVGNRRLRTVQPQILSDLKDGWVGLRKPGAQRFLAFRGGAHKTGLGAGQHQPFITKVLPEAAERLDRSHCHAGVALALHIHAYVVDVDIHVCDLYLLREAVTDWEERSFGQRRRQRATG